ncbi:MAG: hypothetical protein QOK37_1399 [Thermoanaerobaculia bacterium]|jgi:hypothetical protein|nr:hypothetical protein [Thermoanaerobaculia bacterium]
MTRNTNARIAGFTYLFYAAIGICIEVLMHQARGGYAGAAMVARIGQYATNVRLSILIALLECLSSLVLGVTLYGITRDEDHELAMLGLVCRVVEGVLGSVNNIPAYLGMLWLAKEGGGPDIATTNALREFLLMPGASVPIGSIFFAVGSLIFSYLLLRGRMVPVLIAWLGVFASGLLAVTLPLQLAGFSTGPLTGYYQWLPALVFQIVLALWLLIKGVATPQQLMEDPTDA